MTSRLMSAVAASALACMSAPSDTGGAPLLEGSTLPGSGDPALPPVETSPQLADDPAAVADPSAANTGGAPEPAPATEAGKPSETPPPAASPARPAANKRTQARLDPTKKPVRTGARSRKAPPSTRAGTGGGSPVGIVLLTSRVTGPDGRAVARRTIALAPETRADALVAKGWARWATDAETDAATVVLGD